MNTSPKTNQPAQVPSTANNLLRKADALRVRKVVKTAPNPFAKQQPTMNTQFIFHVSKAIAVDNTKMPSNMDFTSMVMLQVQDNE